MNARPLTVAALRELLADAQADAIVVVPGYESGWDHVHGGEVGERDAVRDENPTHGGYDGLYSSNDEGTPVRVFAIGRER